MRRILISIGALLVTVLVVVGVPVLLVAIAGNPLPDWEQLTYPDYGGRFLLRTVLPVLAWAAWAFFTVPFLLALPAAIRNTHPGHAPADGPASPAPLRMQRAAATAVVTAVLVLLGSTAQAAGPTTPLITTTQLSQPSSPAVPADTTAVTADSPSAARVATAPAPYRERIIVPGDTLWDIAEEELGDGLRYPEIFDASVHITQPGGAHLTDADLIYPGWTIRIPTAIPAVPPDDVAPTPPKPPTSESHDPQPSDDATDALTGLDSDSPAPEATPSGSAALSDEAPAIEDPADPGDQAPEAVMEDTVGAVAGISAALAAGVLGVMGMLRLRQRRRRRFGERVPMPAGETQLLETGLRAVEDAPGAEELDRALRYLGSWAALTDVPAPDVYAARLGGDELGLFLATPAILPAPFQPVTADDMVWTLATGALADEGVPGAVNPYPGLLQVGMDPTGAYVLINLESRGVLGVGGDEAFVPGVVTAMLLELATSRWAEQATITVVGQPRGLPRLLGPRRIRHVDRLEDMIVALRARATDSTRLLDDLRVGTLAQARVRSTAESWAPEIVILAATPVPAGPGVLDELTALAADAARTGIVLITTLPEGGDQHELRVESATRAILLPDALELRPQHVDDHTLTLLHDLIRTAAEPPRPAAAVPSATTPDRADLASAPVSSPAQRPSAVRAPDDPAPIGARELTPDRAETGAAAPSPPTGAPYLRVLGPVGLDLDDDPDRPPAPGRGVELVAYLALHPHATTDAFAQAFWPASSADAASASMRKLTNHTRNWLGTAPDGDLYLPRYEPGPGYRLHPAIRTDWDEFRDLVGSDPARADTSALVAALRLVRGQPFTGVKRRFWAWNSLDQEEMIALVGDVAAELFHRAYGAGDNARAGYAATIGNVVDPVNEVAWRNRMLAALATGDNARFEQIVAQLHEFLDGFDDGYEPEPETQQLIDDARRDLVTDP